MAFKNYLEDYKENPFQYRLLELMIKSKKADTAGKLAKELYYGGYLPARDSGDANKSIDKIRKSIERHLSISKSISLSDVAGDYIAAYSSYFNCSSDYLLCKTDIKSVDMNVRKICEATGLSENAVSEMTTYPNTFLFQDIKYLNMLLDAKGFYDFLNAIQNCDRSINEPQEFSYIIKEQSEKLEKFDAEYEHRYSAEVKHYASMHWGDIFLPDEELPPYLDETVKAAIKDYDLLIDIARYIQTEKENIKSMCLYELFTCYQHLVDELFNQDK